VPLGTRRADGPRLVAEAQTAGVAIAAPPGRAEQPELAAAETARMIEDDRYCIDVLTQLAAIDTALEAVALKVLEDHVQHCVAGALASGDAAQAQEKSDELLAAVQRFAKTR